ncbi:FAD-dependent oxidoreductase [Kutzneria sp. CA-103260]|uniref:FAD-dependent oxidoreductase n=1 Tax=Kutzneria sp. CA-103260 TaxID=2802641 RepID=UPI001BAE44F7|nr:NAD(P)/FAD-dependent oxidoreductase [Kutzneria sp. CA-103260]QUQ70056.1 monooxygenase FAD-binding protein [Kutzneria sp. CA-103260]
MDFRVVVIGAGLSGLACAQGLSRLGAEVVVYERDQAVDARPQGYRIQLDPPGLTGLRQCLPAELFELCLATAGGPLAPPRVVDEGLCPRAEQAYMPQAYTPWTQAYPFNRGTLREILLTGLNVCYGKEFTAFERIDGRVGVRFADGHWDSADLVVGADGVGSAVRRQLLPQAKVGDAGLRLIYGKIPLRQRESLPEWVFEHIFTVATGTNRAHVGLGPVVLRNRPSGRISPVDDYIACMVGAPADLLPPFEELRKYGRRDLRSLAGDLIGDGWHPDIHRLLDHWDTKSLFPLRISSASAVEPWSTPGVTLLGDAVHAMSPVLAMGVNTALRDSGELIRAITTGATLPDAVATYQERMLGYALPLVEASRRIGQHRVGQH